MAAPANPSPIPAATGAPHPQPLPNQRASDRVAVTTANALVSATAVTILRAGFIMRSVLLTLPPGEANEESRTPFPDGGMRMRAIAHKWIGAVSNPMLSGVLTQMELLVQP